VGVTKGVALFVIGYTKNTRKVALTGLSQPDQDFIQRRLQMESMP
jgi:hypothetical protein